MRGMPSRDGEVERYLQLATSNTPHLALTVSHHHDSSLGFGWMHIRNAEVDTDRSESYRGHPISL